MHPVASEAPEMVNNQEVGPSVDGNGPVDLPPSQTPPVEANGECFT